MTPLKTTAILVNDYTQQLNASNEKAYLTANQQ